jgi:hypothetical protein
VSLIFEFVLTIHIVFGLIFTVFVAVHLIQRRRTTTRLGKGLRHVSGWLNAPGRLAWADLFLAGLSTAMLASGFWDWSLGHPTRIRWHAVTGFALAALLLTHTFRRRRRLRVSRVT